MRSKIVLGIIRIIIVIALAWFACMAFSRYLDTRIDKLYSEHQPEVDSAYGVSEKNKGNAITTAAFKDTTGMTFMGSSELNTPVEANPRNILPNQYYSKKTMFIGKEYYQNVLDAMYLGANSDYVSSNDCVIVESLTWFVDVNPDGFLSNFSEQAFYQFLHNDKISDANKKYLCERFIEMQDMKASNLSDTASALPDVYNVDVKYPGTYLLAKTYASDSFLDKALYCVLQPYYFIKNDVLSLKDKISSIKYMSHIHGDEKTLALYEIDWDAMYVQEEAYARTMCDNEFNIYNGHYNHIKKDLERLKDSYAASDPLDSEEWGDYRFFLSVSAELGLKPYIVLMSTNGLYYDHLGMTADKRYAFYDKMTEVASEFGFDTLDTREIEYEPYYFYDGSHLGWKGWPYVTEKICYYYAK